MAGTEATAGLAADTAALSRLQALCERLTATANVPQIFEDVLDGMIELAHADFGDFQLLDGNGKKLSIVAQRGLGDAYQKFFSSSDALDNWVGGQAIRDRAPVVIEDIAADARWIAQRAVAGQTGFRAVCAMPLFDRHRGTTVGVVLVHYRAPALPSKYTIAICNLYGELVAGVSAYLLSERRLKANSERLQAAADLLGLGLYSWEPQTNAVEWDARVKAMWGLPPAAEVGYDLWRSRLYPDDVERIEAAMARCIDPSGDGVYEIEYRVNGVDGVERWVSTRGQTSFTGGRAVAFYGVALDITARKAAEARLQDSEERFRQFAEHSTNVLWNLNVESRQFDYVSPAYESAFGRPRGGVTGYWTDAIHPEDRDHAAAELERAALGELVVQEYRVLRPDGTLRWLREIMFPIRHPAGQIKRVGGIAEDITIHNTSHVYVVDGAAASVRLAEFLLRAGYSVKTFPSTADFLDMAPVLTPGCVVVDARESSVGVVEVLRRFKAKRGDLPVVVLGLNDGNVTRAVQAMKSGAVDWLELPEEADELLIAIASALADVHRSAEEKRDADFARARIAGMSDRERQVLEHLLAGSTNKEIGRQLGISPRTVELHRASVMQRLGVKTLPEAVLMAATAGVRPAMTWRRHKAPRELP